MNKLLSILIIAVSVFALAGCVSSSAHREQKMKADRMSQKAESCRQSLDDANKRLNTLINSNAMLIEMNSELESEVSRLDISVRECEFSIREREDEYTEELRVADEKMSELESLRHEISSVIELAEREKRMIRSAAIMFDDHGVVFKNEIVSGGVSVNAIDGKVLLSIKNSLLYKPASATLTDAGGRLLKKAAESLQRLGYSALALRSYADNIQPGGSLKKRYPSNWELTAARAAAVAGYLAGNGLEPEKMVASAMADNFPLADNSTKKGRAMNRRLVFVITPSVVDRTVDRTVDGAAQDDTDGGPVPAEAE